MQAELRAHVASLVSLGRPTRPDSPIFPTRTGGRLNPSNIRNRLFAECVRRANEKREAEGEMLLPPNVTPHTLRRTFASLCYFAGRDPRWVMGQIGHTDARLTLGVYAQVTQRQRVDYGLVWSLMRLPTSLSAGVAPGGSAQRMGSSVTSRRSRRRMLVCVGSLGGSEDGRGGFRTCDLSRVKRG